MFNFMGKKLIYKKQGIKGKLSTLDRAHLRRTIWDSFNWSWGREENWLFKMKEKVVSPKKVAKS